eukprot:CAMPEP_0119096232 /NCGR_PEP_ID=MMETSP1178-20130426/172159_1 /TAXON_ID=33656 /ORGANISM="unid sp, Strain CCMP2000" /LENGTH=84 /DNA_ID=CAMNT_0007080093 /DNA_START=26 /DNA_END=277 /DNA_ORIENTATION=+
MTSANVRRCMGSWMGEVKWKAVVFGAGAWDLSSGNGCCAVDEERLRRVVDNIREVVQVVLSKAEHAIFVTTTPIAETQACCRNE